jgi:hypothetical protein
MSIRVVALPEWPEEEAAPKAVLRQVRAVARVQRTSDPTRRVTALLRWRARRLLREVSAADAASMRAVPALFGASASVRKDLRQNFRVGLRSKQAAARFGSAATANWPPPGKHVPVAIFLLPTERGVTLWLYPHAPGDAALIAGRGQAIQRLLDLSATQILVKMAPDRPEEFRLWCGRVMAFGGILAGQLPEVFLRPDALPLADVIRSGPTALTRLFLSLHPNRTFSPVAALLEGMDQTDDGRLLDTEEFAALAVNGWADDDACLTLLATGARQRDVRGRAGARLPYSAMPPAQAILRAHFTLAVRSGRAVLKTTRRGDAVRKWWQAEVAGNELVPALLEPVSRMIRAPLKLRRAGFRQYEVTDGAGAVLGRGTHPDLARIRATGLLARTIGPRAPVPDGDPMCAVLLPRLARSVGKDCAWLLVDSLDEPGHSGDLLNRGEDRHTCVASASLVEHSTHRRLTVRRLDPAAAPLAAARRAAIEVLPLRTQAHALAARIQQLSTIGDAGSTLPIAVQSNGKVFLSGSRPRGWQLDRIFQRPRPAKPDPWAADISLSPDAPSSKLEFSGMGLGCYAGLNRGGLATMLFRDTSGLMLRETMEPTLVPEYLTQTMGILASGQKQAPFAIRMAPELVERLKQRAPAPEPRVDIRVTGDVPTGLVVEVFDQRFGAGQPFGWRAAAEAILSAWPIDSVGRIVVTQVAVSLNGLPSNGIARLYARSAATRRLKTHIQSLLKSSRPRWINPPDYRSSDSVPIGNQDGMKPTPGGTRK